MKNLQKSILILFLLAFFACKGKENPQPDNAVTVTTNAEWQKNYNFDKTTPFNITIPEPIGEETVVGDGTAESITRTAIQEALDKGGKITFNSGGQAVTVYIDKTLVVKKHRTCIDGGNLITLDARKERRIMYSISAHSVENPRFANDNVAELNWVAKRLIFRNAKTTGGPLADEAPGVNDNDGSGNTGQAGSGAAIWSGLSNQCYVVECQFYDNETRQITGKSEETGGGAIYARGKVSIGEESEMTVIDSYFEGNKATIGGCINNLLTNLRVVRCGFFNNETSHYGGAIYTDGGSSDGVGGSNNPDGFIKIHASIFKGNKGAGQGGAAFLFVYQGAMEVTETLFEENEITNDFRGDALGGALRTGNGISKIQRCAFLNNKSTKQGGAIWVGENNSYNNLIQNSTFTGNSAQDVSSTSAGLGGAVMVGGGNSTIMNCTFWNNNAGQAGALFGGANYSIQNTIFFENTATNPWNLHHQIHENVNMNDKGGNLQYLTFTPAGANRLSNALDQDPLIETTIDSTSGFNPVIKLQSNSPAIGLGSTANNAPTTDQINQSRSGRNDAGAYQIQ